MSDTLGIDQNYKVKPGDSVWSIVKEGLTIKSPLLGEIPPTDKQIAASVKDICTINGKDNCDLIRPGETLINNVQLKIMEFLNYTMGVLQKPIDKNIII